MSDLSDFDNDFVPEDTFGNRAEGLTDGEYEVLIWGAKMKEAKGKPFVEVKFEVLSPGKHQGAMIVEPIWLTSIDNAKRFGAVLKKLGFDSDAWTKANGRPFSKEMPKAIRWLVGMRVQVRKTTSVVAPRFKEDVPHTYHNLNLKGRSDADDGLPRQIGPEELSRPAPGDKDGDPFLSQDTEVFKP
jgi:hypothetical protein